MPDLDMMTDGAFPYNDWISVDPIVDGATPMGQGGLIMVELVDVTAIDSVTIEVTFNEEVKHSNPGDADDALNPSNYAVTSGTGRTPCTASAVTCTQASPTIVRVTILEMTNGATYNCAISNIESIFGAPIDPAHDDKDFTGIGVKPQVSTAQATNSTHVRVTFNEDMDNNAALTTAGNYTFTGPTTLTASSVSRDSATQVTVEVNEMEQSSSYEVTVASTTGTIQDVAYNALDTDHDTATFTGVGDAPSVDSASATDSTHVRVTYDEAMANNAALIDAANYVITGDTVITTVSVVRDNPTQVTVECSELLDLGNYTITVSNVEDLAGNVIDPAHDDANFTGIGVPPQVIGATAPSAAAIKVEFDSDMMDTAQLKTASRYNITGPTTITPTGVTVVDPDVVRLAFTGEMHTGGAYTVTVGPPYTGIVDLAWNTLDPAHSDASFTGVGIAPTVTPAADCIDHTTVDVTFSEPVEETSAEITTHYVITGEGGLSVVGAVRVVPTRVRLTTGPQVHGGNYTITVSDVTDLALNVVDPAHDTATFIGRGLSPPSIEYNIETGTIGVVTRSSVYIHVYDSSTEFTGIDLTKSWTLVTYTQDGETRQLYAVLAGVIQPGFEGAVTGDPMGADGVTFQIRPLGGWQENTVYTLNTYAEDFEANTNQEPCVFTTSSLRCFEDLPTARRGNCPLDAVLAAPLAQANIEKIRRLLGKHCTRSADWQVRARTMMTLACMTELKTLLASQFDFSWVSATLCDRVPILEIHAALRPYFVDIVRAVPDIPGLTEEGRTLLMRYLSHDSSIYFVNAVAVIVVLTAAINLNA